MRRRSRNGREAAARVTAALVAAACAWLAAGAGTVRSTVEVAVPAVTLTDQDGRAVPLATELGRPGPVLLQFVFTTCSTVCPVLSRSFAAVQERLPGARLLSISIDPEEDTPERLAAYARRFGAGPSWRLLTGRLDDVIAVERAFGAYRGNKMRHEPATFVRAGPGRPWLRLAGLPAADDLAAAVAELAGAPAPSARDPAPAGALAEREGGAAPPAPVTAGPAEAAAGGAAAGEAAVVARGRRIYRDGILATGEPLRAAVTGGAALADVRLACAGCHRPSGYGGVEGGALVPPITGPALFGSRGPSAAELQGKLYREELAQASWARLRSAAAARRPAYTAATLAAAVRQGTDPAGRTLDPLMPRYELGSGDMDDLAAYLRTLSAASAPGVDAATIHLAVVVAGDVDAERRRAVVEVAEAFVRNKNDDTRRLLARPATSPGYRDEVRPTWRLWALHVWELHGPAAGWDTELERRYRAQPVFALLSGIAVAGAEWRPVHEFCERREVPCLFPNTELPVTAPAGVWTLYLSPGLAAEGRALARHLAERSGPRPGGTAGAAAQRLIEVYRDTPPGRTAAAALREALVAARPGRRLEEVVIGAAETVTDAVLAPLLDPGRPAALILWLDRADLARLVPALAARGGAIAELDLSYALLGETLPSLPGALAGRTRLTFRYALPEGAAPEGYRARSWLRSREAAGAQERLRLDTLFAFAMAADAVDRLTGNFSRAYFVETVEREAERAPNPGVYPHLGLGAGQRFAAKGCYIVKLVAGTGGGAPSLAAEGGLIVP